MTFPYTICFCRCKDSILMLYRRRPLNSERWNGLGGKIASGETPLECVRREVLEEAGIDLRRFGTLRFAGVVTWKKGVDPTQPSTGMYAFVAELPDNWFVWKGTEEAEEGLLAWKPLGWVCNPHNEAVVSNVSRFLPGLLNSREPMEYHCEYEGDELVDLVVLTL
jgi:8-oxo-dGTP diphosphatase